MLVYKKQRPESIRLQGVAAHGQDVQASEAERSPAIQDTSFGVLQEGKPTNLEAVSSPPGDRSMSRIQTALSIALLLSLGNARVSAGVIRNSHGAPSDRISPPSAIEAPDGTSQEFSLRQAGRKLARETSSWAELTKASLIATDLAALSLVQNVDSFAAAPRPSLPSDPLLGAGFEQMLNPDLVPTYPVLASSAVFGHNIRIPEPASLALVAAGIVGLIARKRLRKNI